MPSLDFNHSKRIAIIHTQLKCIDGVSIEVEKWRKAYEQLGHKVFYVAGKFCTNPNIKFKVIPEIDYTNATIESIKKMAFDSPLDEEEKKVLLKLIKGNVQKIKSQLLDFIKQNRIDLLSIENVLAIPLNIPLGIALTEIIREQNIPAIMRHHDFFWERNYFIKYNNIPYTLGKNFPPKLPGIQHVSISKIAKDDLLRWTGLEATVIPNAVDFDLVVKKDAYNKDFRKCFGISPKQILFLQPTRILERKKIERSIQLVAEINKKFKEKDKAILLVSGPVVAGSEDYFHFLVDKANELNVKVIFGHQQIYIHRMKKEGKKIYSIGDAYVNCDAVTFPSDIEGFGNVVIEACAYKKPLFTNLYPVLREIKKKGFEFVEMDGELKKETVNKMYKLLTDPVARKKVVEKNYSIVQKQFSVETLKNNLAKLIEEADKFSVDKVLAGISSSFLGILNAFKPKR